MTTKTKNTETTSIPERKMVKLKVCGMTYAENILEVSKLQPDYLGFIFYKKSSRYFNSSMPDLPESIRKVGVFVNASVENIMGKIKTYKLQAIQLHGEETPAFLQKLKMAIDESCSNSVEIIKMFSMANDFDFSVLEPYEAMTDYYLFDTKGKLPGGNGYTFDWSVLNHYPSTKPYFLSGGIGLLEINSLNAFLKTEAATYCHVIDVNSKFEIDPGVKASEQLQLFKEKLSGVNAP